MKQHPAAALQEYWLSKLALIACFNLGWDEILKHSLLLLQDQAMVSENFKMVFEDGICFLSASSAPA